MWNDIVLYIQHINRLWLPNILIFCVSIHDFSSFIQLIDWMLPTYRLLPSLARAKFSGRLAWVCDEIRPSSCFAFQPPLNLRMKWIRPEDQPEKVQSPLPLVLGTPNPIQCTINFVQINAWPDIKWNEISPSDCSSVEEVHSAVQTHLGVCFWNAVSCSSSC